MSQLTLDEARRLTNLGAYSATQLLRLLRGAVGADGTISRHNFQLFCDEVLGDRSHLSGADDEDRLRVLRRRLYDIFDTNGDGVVHFAEMASGLSVLCGGSADAKARLAFKVYETDGDDVISQQEMTRYLTAVFTMTYALDPTMQGRTGGASAAAAGAQAAAEAFAEADLDVSGNLTFEEFQRWQHRDPAVSQLTLDEARRLTNLGAYSAEELLELFAGGKQGGRRRRHGFNREEFQACFDEVLGDRGHLSGAGDEDRLRVLRRRLYDIFDTNGDGVVQFAEMASGLSVLCGGSADAKARLAFKLYNVNGDGVISQEEMTRYLTAVFTVTYALEPSTQEPHGRGQRGGGRGAGGGGRRSRRPTWTADGNLTFEEFQKWHHKPVVQLSVAEARRLTNLGAYSAEELLELFTGARWGAATVSRAAFDSCLDFVVGDKSHLSGAGDEDRLRVLRRRLYDIFDTNGDGVVQFAEMASGLSVLCGGSADAKARLAFKLYNANGDGVISQEEMTRYLTAVFTMTYALDPSTQGRMGGASAELAAAQAAAEAFAEARLAPKTGISRRKLFELMLPTYTANPSALEVVERYLGLPVRPDGGELAKRVDAMVVRADANGDGVVGVDELANLFAAVAYQKAIDHHEYEAESEARELVGDGDGITAEELYALLGESWEDPANAEQLAAAERYLGVGVGEKTKEQRIKEVFAAIDLDFDGQVSWQELKEVLMVVRVEATLEAQRGELQRKVEEMIGEGMPAEEVRARLEARFADHVDDLEVVEKYLGLGVRPDGIVTSYRVARVVEAIDLNHDHVIDARELYELHAALTYHSALQQHEYDAEEEARELAGEDGISPTELYAILGESWADPAREADLAAAEKYLEIVDGDGASQPRAGSVQKLLQRTEHYHHDRRSWHLLLHPHATIDPRDAELQENIEEEEAFLRVRRVFDAFDLDDDGLISMKEVKQVLLATRMSLEVRVVEAQAAADARRVCGKRGGVPRESLFTVLLRQYTANPSALEVVERYLGLPVRPDGGMVSQRLDQVLDRVDANGDDVVGADELANLFAAVAYQKAIDHHEYEAESEARELVGDGDGITAEELYALLGESWEDPANAEQLAAAERYLGVGVGEKTKEQRIKEVFAAIDLDFDGQVSWQELKEVLMAVRVEATLEAQRGEIKRTVAAVVGAAGMPAEEVRARLEARFADHVDDLEVVEKYLGLGVRPDGIVTSYRVARVVEAIDLNHDHVIDARELYELHAALTYHSALQQHEYDAEEEARELAGEDGISPTELYAILGESWADPAREADLAAAEKYLDLTADGTGLAGSVQNLLQRTEHYHHNTHAWRNLLPELPPPAPEPEPAEQPPPPPMNGKADPGLEGLLEEADDELAMFKREQEDKHAREIQKYQTQAQALQAQLEASKAQAKLLEWQMRHPGASRTFERSHGKPTASAQTYQDRLHAQQEAWRQKQLANEARQRKAEEERRAAAQLMGTRTTSREVALARLRKQFTALDVDGNGVLTFDEVDNLARGTWASFQPAGAKLSFEQRRRLAQRLKQQFGGEARSCAKPRGMVLSVPESVVAPPRLRLGCRNAVAPHRPRSREPSPSRALGVSPRRPRRPPPPPRSPHARATGTAAADPCDHPSERRPAQSPSSSSVAGSRARSTRCKTSTTAGGARRGASPGRPSGPCHRRTSPTTSPAPRCSSSRSRRISRTSRPEAPTRCQLRRRARRSGTQSTATTRRRCSS